MYGMFAVQEPVTPEAREAVAPVFAVEVRVVLGNGGMLASAATLVPADHLP
jgi:hypothetical protein